MTSRQTCSGGDAITIVSNVKLSEADFLRERQRLVGLWPTAGEIDLDEAVEYCKQLPSASKWASALSQAKANGKPLVGVYLGKSTLEETLDEARYLEQSGADFIWLIPDTYTRRGSYAEAEKALQASIRGGASLLNGLPVVNYGHKKLRRIREAVSIPLWISDTDSALIAEMGMACGMGHSSTDVETLIRTMKDYPAERRIRDVQYMDRLAGYYTERGVPVDTYIHNAFCGFDPPEMKVAVGVLHALLVAEQGVTHISQSLGLGCHVLQDVAALRTAKEMTAEYLQRSGHKCALNLSIYPFTGLWSSDRNEAAGAVALNTTIAIMAGADWFITKSLDEGRSVPTREANAGALRLAKQLVHSIGKQRLPDSGELAAEKDIIRKGARAIIEKTLDLGDGDPALGQVRALEQGVIDAQFSPYRKIRGKVVSVRDSTGAVRYLDAAGVPLPGDVLEYHKYRVAEREKASGKTRIDMITEDIYHLARSVEIEAATVGTGGPAVQPT